MTRFGSKSFAASLAALSMALFASTAGAAAISNLTGSSAGTPGSNTTHGWTFVANQDLVVTDLGVFDLNSDGLGIDLDVGLFRLSDAALLTSGSLTAGTGDPLIDGFRYVDTADVALTAGTTYVVAYYSSVTHAGNGIITNATTVTVDPAITYGNARFSGAGSLVLPSTPTGADAPGSL